MGRATAILGYLSDFTDLSLSISGLSVCFIVAAWILWQSRKLPELRVDEPL